MNAFVYPWIDRKIGPLAVNILSAILMIPTLCVYPLLNYLLVYDFSSWFFWTSIVIVMMVKVTLGAGLFTAIMILVNNSADRSLLGAVNGVAQSAVALTRAFAPFIAGSILSATLTADLPWPLDFCFFFYFSAVLVGCSALCTYFLPSDIEHQISSGTSIEVELEPNSEVGDPCRETDRSDYSVSHDLPSSRRIRFEKFKSFEQLHEKVSEQLNERIHLE